MKKKLLILSLAVLPMFPAAQDIYTPVLEQVEAGSTRLKALREVMEAEKLSYRTGLAPADPVVDGGYLFGELSAIGNRKDLSIRQQLDFPTVYAAKGKLADVRSTGAEYRFAQKRMELLLEAKRLCIELIHYNALGEQYDIQHERAEQIAETFRRKLESGAANQLEFNKASLNLSQVRQKRARALVERESLLSELRRLTGNPALQHLRSEAEVASREVSLAKASALPKLSVGYMGEFVAGQTFQGVTFGMSIPLWENRGRIQHTDAARLASERVVEDASDALASRLRILFKQVRSMQEALSEYDDALAGSRSDELLYKAFEKGELPLLNYLLEMGWRHSPVHGYGCHRNHTMQASSISFFLWLVRDKCNMAGS